MFLFISIKKIPHWHRLLLITNWFIYPFGSFLHHLITYSNLSNPTSPKLTKLTQKLYKTFPLRSITLHKHSKLMHTTSPHPNILFALYTSSFIYIHTYFSFPQKNSLAPLYSLTLPTFFFPL